MLTKNILKEINSIYKENQKVIRETYKTNIRIINKSINNQLYLNLIHLMPISSGYGYNIDSFCQMCLTACFKNLITLNSCLELTLKGEYGTARMLFRYIVENLYIAKTIVITKDLELLDKWKKGDIISLKNNIFKKVIKPDSEHLKEMWTMLCEFTHGTIYSQQVSFKFKDIKTETDFNFTFMNIILILNYHVFNSYACTPSLKYYTRQMQEISDDNSYITIEKNEKKNLKELEHNLNKKSKSVIRDFRKRWIFKS